MHACKGSALKETALSVPTSFYFLTTPTMWKLAINFC